MSQVVPGRNDAPAGIDVYSRSRAGELSGKDPGFEYQYASKDPQHPQYVGNYLKRREVGNQLTGYALMDPWEVVTEGQGVEQGRKRADDGKPVDTTLTHGSLVLIRTPKTNAAKAHWANQAMTDATAKALSSGERDRVGSSLIGTKVFHGNGESGAIEAPVVSAQLTGGK